MKKLFLNPRCRYWCDNIYPRQTEEWTLVNKLSQSDCVITLDMPIFFKTKKKKIVYLIEPEDIFESVYRFTYQKMFSLTNAYDVIITHHKKYVDNKKIFYAPPPFATWIEDKKVFSKSKLCSMITSNKVLCQGHLKRIETAQKFLNKLDVYGIGFNEISSKSIGLNDYCFSIAMENQSTEGYYTEKLLDCFLTGTVPIYHGDPMVSDVYDIRGIIRLTDDFSLDHISFDLYNSMLPFVKTNFEIALENYKQKYNSIQSFISSGFKKL